MVDGLFDQARGACGPMLPLVEGLRIPRHIEHRHSWLWPHLWLNRGVELRVAIEHAFVSHSCQFKSMLLKNDFDLDVDVLVTLVDTPTAKQSKSEWRVLLSITARIAATILLTSAMNGGRASADSFLAGYRKGFEEGRLDLAALFTSGISTSRVDSVVTTTPPAAEVRTATGRGPNSLEAPGGRPQLDYTRLQEMISLAVHQHRPPSSQGKSHAPRRQSGPRRR
jgi:hypothetical protein